MTKDMYDGIKINRNKVVHKGDSSNRRVEQRERTFSAVSNIRDVPDEAKRSDFIVKEVDIFKIKGRNENNYIIGDIPELAESIKAVGVLQPIIIAPLEEASGDFSYFVSAGHRRLAACKYLYQMAKQEWEQSLDYNSFGESAEMKKYRFVRAKILTSDEAINEERIHFDTNALARRTTVFEMLLKYNIKEWDLESDEFAQMYLEEMADDAAVKKAKLVGKPIKHSERTLHKLLEVKLKKDWKVQEGGAASSLKRPVTLILHGDQEVINACLSGTITFTEAYDIVFRHRQAQHEALNRIMNGEKDFKGQVKVEVSEIEEDTLPSNYDSIFKKFARANKDVRQLMSQAEELDRKKLTPNQREFIKRAKKIIKLLDELDAMPK